MRRKNPTKQKMVPAGFYMVLIVALHKEMESVMRKHPSALETCFSLFLHQLKTLPKKAKLPPVQGPCTHRECKGVAMSLHIFPQEKSQARLKRVGSSILFLLWKQCESYAKWGKKAQVILYVACCKIKNTLH